MTTTKNALSSILKGVFAMPEPLADLIISAPQIEVDGRVLDRRVQLLIKFVNLLGGRSRSYDPSALRSEMERVAGIAMPRRGGVHSHDRTIPGPDGTIRVRIYRPHGEIDRLPAIVYLHGGGWVVGSLDTHDGTCRLLASEARCVVVAVDYRLAPEHPFPAPLDDAFAGYAWVIEHALELGVEEQQIGVMGDSAGGNLAAVVAANAATRGLPVPAAQGLVYPATDAHFGTASYHALSKGFLLEDTSMEFYRGCYLPDESDWDSPLASPLLATDLTGAPPAVVVTCGFDPLRDEGDAYAQRLREAGGAVWHRCWDDQIHGAFGMGILPGGMARCSEVCQAMGQAVRGKLP